MNPFRLAGSAKAFPYRGQLLPLVLFPFFFLPLSIPKMFHVKHFASSFLKIVSRETIERGCDKIR